MLFKLTAPVLTVAMTTDASKMNVEAQEAVIYRSDEALSGNTRGIYDHISQYIYASLGLVVNTGCCRDLLVGNLTCFCVSWDVSLGWLDGKLVQCTFATELIASLKHAVCTVCQDLLSELVLTSGQSSLPKQRTKWPILLHGARYSLQCYRHVYYRVLPCLHLIVRGGGHH